MTHRLIFVTTPSRESAMEIGRTLVEERLAACAVTLDGATSTFRWQGEIEEAREAVLYLKTTEARTAAVIARVKEMHAYSVPCVIALPILAGNPDFLNWISAETA